MTAVSVGATEPEQTEQTSSARSDPQSPSLSRLPRCAVVKFSKEGGIVSTVPRVSIDTAGIAAKIVAVDNANFLLEEFSLRDLGCYTKCDPYVDFTSTQSSQKPAPVPAGSRWKYGPFWCSVSNRARSAAAGDACNRGDRPWSAVPGKVSPWHANGLGKEVMYKDWADQITATAQKSVKLGKKEKRSRTSCSLSRFLECTEVARQAVVSVFGA